MKSSERLRAAAEAVMCCDAEVYFQPPTLFAFDSPTRPTLALLVELTEADTEFVYRVLDAVGWETACAPADPEALKRRSIELTIAAAKLAESEGQ